MTSYNLSSLRVLEESFRQEMIEKERMKNSKVHTRKKKVDVFKKMETSLQDAELRLKRNDYKHALALYNEVRS